MLLGVRSIDMRASRLFYGLKNLFSNTASNFLYEEWLALPKAAMYNGQGFSFW